MRNKLPCLSLLLMISSIQAAPEMKGNPNELKSFLYPDKRIVTIASTAKQKAYSDKAIISLVITTEEDKLSVAVQKNSDLRGKVSAILTEAGIKPGHIKTSKFSTSPQFGWFGKEPDSFQVVNRMAISIYNEAQLNAIASISDENKEVALSDTEFEHTMKAEFENKVKENALAKVMHQKSFYEKTLGLQLKAVAFRDFDVVQAGSRGAQAYGERITITGSRLKRSSDKTKASSVVTPQTFDEVEYSATISVDFEIVHAD